MAKTLFDVMDGSDNCLDEFKSACSELAEAKYILAEKKIATLLQTIAKSKRLYALMADCMEGFHFASALASAKQTDKNGTPVLVLPSERKANIAFVFCLLLSFDTGQTDFKRFLHTFYGSPESANAEFSEFAFAVVVPFCDDVVNLYISEAGGVLRGAQQERAGEPVRVVAQNDAPQDPQRGFSEEPRYARPEIAPAPAPKDAGSAALLDAVELSLITCAKEVIGIAARDPSMGAKEREELLLLSEAFIQSVRFGAEKPVRTMYIALRNTIRISSIARKLETQGADLERLMEEY